MNFRHAGIVVSDIKKSLNFYKNMLGLKVVKDAIEVGTFIDSIQGLKNVKVNTVKMVAEDGGMIELLYFHSHPEKPRERPFTEIGASHVAFTVDNLDDEYERLLKHNIKFNCKPMVSPDGFAKVSFCRDPDGTLIELVEIL